MGDYMTQPATSSKPVLLRWVERAFADDAPTTAQIVLRTLLWIVALGVGLCLFLGFRTVGRDGLTCGSTFNHAPVSQFVDRLYTPGAIRPTENELANAIDCQIFYAKQRAYAYTSGGVAVVALILLPVADEVIRRVEQERASTVATQPQPTPGP